VLETAGMGHYTPKDARDSFGSWLLTSGIPIAYISKQLGRSTIAITEKLYAKLIGNDYRQPPQLSEGEVPPDLLTRLVSEAESHHESHKTRTE
jgi:integrase